MTVVATLVLGSFVLTYPQEPSRQPPDCATVQECRQLALDAATRQDYETFHDLAWRAVQKGPKNDPQLMLMLARAQSLSGRPGDALVMLQRLTAMGVATDAATSDDFRRVRVLPGWSDLQRTIEERSGELKAVEPSAADRKPTAPTPNAAREMEPAKSTASTAKSAMTARAPSESSTTGAPKAATAPGEMLRFTTPSFVPAGLAHDRVSDRFIVGDRDARKLSVVDEASQRVANLAGAQSAGFGNIGALEIDAREGDLWVVTTKPDAQAGGVLHKLQLISGRVLYALPLPNDDGPAHFADVAVTPHSSVVVLDSAGQRLFTVAPKSHDLKVAARLEAKAPSSVAPASDTVAYVSVEKGLVQVDLASHRARLVKSSKKVDLAGLTRIRWHRGSLVGVQKDSNGRYRIVRIRLDDGGRTAKAIEVLDRDVAMPDPTAVALSGDVLYYLARGEEGRQGSEAQTIIRQVLIK